MKAAEFGNDNSAVKFGNKRIIALFAFCNEKVAGGNSDRRGDTGASGVGGGGNTRLSCGFKIVKKALKYAVFNNNSFYGRCSFGIECAGIILLKRVVND